MDLLRRSKAPLTTEAWQQVDEEAKRVLELHLAGRKVVDFSGPHGWHKAAVNTGRLGPATSGPIQGVSYALRIAQPLTEVRSPFTMKIEELDFAARGAKDLNLDPAIAAAERAAHAEDRAIFHGSKEALVTGIIEASPHKPIDVHAILDWPKAVVAALEVLRKAGVDGPYALAMGVHAYDELDADSEHGYPLRRRVAEGIPGVTLVWAPAIDGGAVLLSTRGGDYELTVGQDWSVGYAAHDRTDVELYLTESFTFRVLEEKAAIFLRRGAPPKA